MSKTGDLWRNKRDMLWTREGQRCHYCRGFFAESDRTIDHVVPRAFGGPNAPWNLVPCCEPCNSKWGDAVQKCDCAACKRAIHRFHKEKKKATDGAVVEWRRRHVSEDWMVTDLLRRLERCRQALDEIADQDSRDGAALRGKINGLREALSVVAVNRVTGETEQDAAG